MLTKIKAFPSIGATSSTRISTRLYPDETLKLSVSRDDGSSRSKTLVPFEFVSVVVGDFDSLFNVGTSIEYVETDMNSNGISIEFLSDVSNRSFESSAEPVSCAALPHQYASSKR